METGGAVVIVMEIVFVGPKKFYGNAGDFGDGGGFAHVVVGEAAAEAATGAFHVDDDVAGGNAHEFGDLLAAGFGSLAGRPEFEFAIVEMGEAVLRLHGSVSEEGIGIGGFDDFCSGGESGVGVAVFAQGDGGSLRGER